MTAQTRGEQDRHSPKQKPRFIAYIPIKEGFSIESIMKEELISLRHSPPLQQKYARVSIKVQEVICPKSS